MQKLKWQVRELAQRALPKTMLTVLANRRWLHEPEVAILPMLVRANGVALDVGANKGVYLYHLSRAFGRVVAFEPLPPMASFLKRAAPRNTQVHAVALSDRDGSAVLQLPAGFNELATIEHHCPVEQSDGELQSHVVQRRTLDSFALPEVDLIKIDVEGHEAAVLDGARETIERSAPAILIEVEERHRRGSVASVISYLRSLGYEGFFLDGRRMRSIAEFDVGRDQNPDSLTASVKRGRYLNNFVFIDSKVSGRRVSAINDWLSRSGDVRAAA